MDLTVVHPDCIEQCRRMSGKWIYADENLTVYQRIESTLGSSLGPLIGPADFQAAVARLRKNFVAWVDENLTSKAVEQWILTPLYKNPFSNNLFLHISWLCVIVDVIEHQSTDIIVITD